ncbi:zinc finger protein 541 [Triplophysa rosa]|nr:zinc finger protein 541 [Triplophysa rosa]
MCCSSVLTGGGTNIELALHCLHEVQGNIPAALDLLLMREDFRITRHPLNNYHYTGSDHWTDQEMRLFRTALEDHGKDFNKIHNVLQTKSVAQCVEYYYIWKNLKKFKQRVQAADEKDVEETSVFQDSQKTPPEQTRMNNTRRTGVQKRYPCEEEPLHLDQDRDWLPPGHKDTMSKDLYGP